jgi:hypothetical protein
LNRGIRRRRLRQFGEPPAPINSDAGNRSKLGSSLQFESGRASVMSCFEPVNSQHEIDGIYEPNFTNTRSLVSGEFEGLVVAGGTR